MSGFVGDLVTKVRFVFPQDIRDFVYATQAYKFKVSVQSENYIVNGKSILGVLSLDLTKPVEVIVDTGLMSHFNEEDYKQYLVDIDRWVVK